MGVDVVLYARGRIPHEQLVTANEFFNARIHASEYEQKIGYFGLVAEPYPEDRIKWETLTRYYGPGYERGDWPSIHAAIVALRAALPNLSVFYGGDTSDLGQLVTDEFLAEMWEHWLGPDGLAYRQR